MKKSLLWVCAAATLTLGSCVSKKQFVALQTENQSLSKSYQEAQVQLAESRAKATSLEERLAEARKSNEELLKQYNTLQASLDKSIQLFRYDSDVPCPVSLYFSI